VDQIDGQSDQGPTLDSGLIPDGDTTTDDASTPPDDGPLPPDSTVSDSTVSDTTVSDTTVSDTTVPDATVPDTTVPDATVPDTTVPDATVPDTTVPDATPSPDAAVPDAAVPDAAVSDAAVPDAAVPDAAVPDAAVPDAAVPDAAVPDAAVPDAAVPDAGPLPPGALFVDPVTGDDTNPGSLAEPWQTLDHAFAQLVAGDTLVLRQGTYNETDLDLDVVGTAADPVTIRSYPGEDPIIDASLEEFRATGNSEWVLVDAAIGLYRSTGTGYGSDVYVGKLVHQGDYYNLVAYSDMENDGMANISSTEENVTAGVRYVGPGIYNDGGQLYIRLQPHSPSALHGRTYTIPANTDPGQNALYISDESSVINVSGAYINIADVDITFGRHGIAIDPAAHHIQISDLTINVPYIGVHLEDGAHHVTIDNVDFESSFPPWLAWTDMKGSDGQSQPARHWNNKSAGVNGSDVHDVEIKNSRFWRVFDGSTMDGYNIHIHHNDYVVLDDMIQLGTSSYDVEIDHNTILGAGPSHNGNGSSSQPGTKYIHHNVIYADIDMLWGKNDPSGILRFNYSGWHGQTAFPTHTSSEIGTGDPWKIYFNTILFNGSLHHGGCGIEQWTTTNSTGVAHEVYNNIIVELGGGILVEDLSTQDGLQIYDGNLYHRNVSSSEPLWADVVDSSGTQDFDSLADFLGSATFQDSKSMIPTGWEANGIEADPLLDADYHPSASGPAASGAVSIPAQLPGPRHAYRGALAPK
jgi:hypothetical protein